MLSVDGLMKLDQEVINKYHKKLIRNLNVRGWAVYSSELANFAFLSEDELQACIEKGAEKEYLKSGVLYSLLPYVENDSNWEKVREAMTECVFLKRYPFFVEVFAREEKDAEYADSNGVYLIDSIVFDDDAGVFELTVDYDLSTFLGITQKRRGNIELELMYVDKLLKQLTKRVNNEKK